MAFKLCYSFRGQKSMCNSQELLRCEAGKISTSVVVFCVRIGISLSG